LEEGKTLLVAIFAWSWYALYRTIYPVCLQVSPKDTERRYYSLSGNTLGFDGGRTLQGGMKLGCFAGKLVTLLVQSLRTNFLCLDDWVGIGS